MGTTIVLEASNNGYYGMAFSGFKLIDCIIVPFDYTADDFVAVVKSKPYYSNSEVFYNNFGRGACFEHQFEYGESCNLKKEELVDILQVAKKDLVLLALYTEDKKFAREIIKLRNELDNLIVEKVNGRVKQENAEIDKMRANCYLMFYKNCV
ncbi:hypothetical protein [Paenibacillus donghaensis]|uniref:Uncharacterized protein n=1 Tax=Paenibacillus donghaensis TaxID=414771 RepID=A0A2Z2KRX1_9BACL|nr:hypothetical protein [Paenibacillus donghaensis]ASA21798.1 hypothetical protein B9T62_14070 [Paenibacillus donghaensis]